MTPDEHDKPDMVSAASVLKREISDSRTRMDYLAGVYGRTRKSADEAEERARNAHKDHQRAWEEWQRLTKALRLVEGKDDA